MFVTFEGLDKYLSHIRADDFFLEIEGAEPTPIGFSEILGQEISGPTLPGLEIPGTIRIPIPVFRWANDIAAPMPDRIENHEGLTREEEDQLRQEIAKQQEVVRQDPANTPMNNFIWRNMTIRHRYGGTAISHAVSSKLRDLRAAQTGQELRGCTFSSLRLISQNREEKSRILDVEGAKFCTFRDITFSGASSGTGLRLVGQRNLLETLYAEAPGKKGPGLFLDIRSGDTNISHVRNEAGNSVIASIWIHDCSNLDILNLSTEGLFSQSLVTIENCQGITLRSANIAYLSKFLEASLEEPPIGLKFVNSSYCTVVGSKINAQGRIDPEKEISEEGYALVFDSNSQFNTIISSNIVSLGYKRWLAEEQIRDLGANNNWSIISRTRDNGGTFFLDRSTET